MLFKSVYVLHCLIVTIMLMSAVVNAIIWDWKGILVALLVIVVTCLNWAFMSYVLTKRQHRDTATQ
jgi:membrane protein implicated in regulation of membrane protease activity